MQLKHKQTTDICKRLSAATCTLLSGTASASGLIDGWDFDTAVLYYSESDNRVTAFEPVIRGTRELDDDEFLNLKLVVDALTGATPTGAMPSSQPQTFTRPSGNGSYTVAPGEIPLDDTFHDTRVAVNASWDKPINRLLRATYGVNVSSEYDFKSFGANVTIARDFNQKNTTLNGGISFESDTLDPEGGIPIELSSAMVPAGLPQNRRAADESRSQVDLLLGLTQVISRRTLMQFNLSVSQSDGYHTDPFKFISIIDDTPGPTQGDPIDNIFENRPDSRSKTSFFWKMLHHFDTDAIDASYRYLTDDWGIKSHTVDFHYTFVVDGGRSYWQPHVRFYSQSAADFYATNLRASEPIPDEISADYRLGDMTGVTLGLKYSRTLANENEMAFRFELLNQSGDPSPGSRIGNLAGLKIVPDTEAVIFQFQYSFR